jgi:HK97 family phage prohead protease
VIEARGWQLANFNANPVALFGHDAGSVENVIGRARNVRVEGSRLVGDIEFMRAEVNPNAEAVFQMVKGGYLKTVSVGFAPIEWEAASDKSRPYGVNFKKQELLEISVVPIPANPNALIQAKAAGIAIERLGLKVKAQAEWKCGAERDLPVQKDGEWDSPGAEARIFAACGFDGASPDPAKARRAFLFHDASAPMEKGSYREPVADHVDGRFVVVAAAVRAAASRLAGIDVPEELKAAGREVLDGYEAKLKDETGRSARALARAYRKRGLYELSSLCELISYADYVCRQVEAEAADEGDGSPVPARMRAWINEGNAIIAAMASEETAENIAGTQGRRVAAEVARAVKTALEGLGLAKAGKAISAANEKTLREAHGHMTAACECVMSVVEPDDDEDPEEGTGENDPTDDEKALRARKAAALRRRLALVGA